MFADPTHRQVDVTALIRLAGAFVFTSMLSSCANLARSDDAALLRQTASLIDAVKLFGQSLGIQPTEALRRTAQAGPTLSMLWLWMQRDGTLALNRPVDIRLAIGLTSENEVPKLEQVYRVDGYSVYHRQGSEFADPRSVATVGFAEEPIVRRVKVILHEDLHGDVNFALPWEIEEAIVTPLGSLAALEYFRQAGNENNLANAVTSVAEERKVSRELQALVAQAEKIFAAEKADSAKEKILALLPNFSSYQRQFERQTRGQHSGTVLEAKLSHDLAYYRYFDDIAGLAERAPSLAKLIEDLKRLPKDATPVTTEKFLRELNASYGAASK
ncbi:MAG: hypothetical protein EXR70_08295 [Deltaproteobacteria bacterium]|nr:hypothetical protein [Deltaproteobacteria bacterium]